LDHSVRTGGNQEAASDPASRVANAVGRVVAEDESEKRHACLKEAEDDSDLEPTTGCYAGDADADSGSEVREPERAGDEDQRKH
jgi:hypothetical protein